MSVSGVVVFDVNETLSDLAPLSARFAEVGAPELAARWWFASLLRDGFALAATARAAPFSAIAAAVLRSVLAEWLVGDALEVAVGHILAGFASLELHPDVVEAVGDLRARECRLVTLSNGSPEVAERLLGAAGIRSAFELVLSVEQAGIWKPAAAAYRYGATRCGVEPAEMVLVAVHPWDVDGATRAGLSAVWVDRGGTGAYPEYFVPPTQVVRSLADLGAALDRL